MAQAKRFLIIDDDPAMVVLLKFIVEKNGSKADTATGTWAAVELLKKHAYDVIVADASVADKGGPDGPTLLQELAALRNGPNDSYLKSVKPANAQATKVLFTGAGGSYTRSDGSGYNYDELSHATRVTAEKAVPHLSGIDRIEIKPGNPLKLIAELCGNGVRGAGR